MINKYNRQWSKFLIFNSYVCFLERLQLEFYVEIVWGHLKLFIFPQNQVNY